jgi:hypothetical protein
MFLNLGKMKKGNGWCLYDFHANTIHTAIVKNILVTDTAFDVNFISVKLVSNNTNIFHTIVKAWYAVVLGLSFRADEITDMQNKDHNNDSLYLLYFKFLPQLRMA